MRTNGSIPSLLFAAWSVVAVFGASVSTSAATSVATLSPPGGFVAACGGLADTTGAHVPGQDLQAFYLGASNCTSASFASGGSATTAAAFDNGTVVNSASGTVGWGTMQFEAQHVSPNDERFPYGSVSGGWEETFTIDAPGLTGTDGLMVYSIDVSGSWVLSGFAGAARITVAAFKDDVRTEAEPVYAALNGIIGCCGFDQGMVWSSSFFENGVNATLFLTVPFVYGEAFDLGVFATLRAGLRSVSGVAGLSTSHADFSNSATWGGIHDILADGVAVTDYTVLAASGTDWSAAITPIPLPASGLLLLGALAAGRRLARRRYPGGES